MEPGAAIRTARAGVFTALLLALSAGGHVLLTGTALPAPVVAVAAVVVFAAALLLSGRERGFGQIAAVLVPLELALNAFYNAGQATCGPGGARGGGLLPDLLCGTGPVHDLGPVPVLPGQLTSGQLTVVVLAHVGAALVAALWLRQGEKAVFRLLTVAAVRTWRPVRILLAWLLPAEPEQALPAWAFSDDERRGPQEVLRRCTRRRGPPSLVPALIG
ncbi:hypothetical protein LN042_03240 [Kitasatospora sp. RB6PN24]|uniref:hypothetical protein n=1 Tax=Kitasatospora humi TaxID=2893891 RepID=UPI001E367AF3|nr:hypothetical protein [Kitasatospora humi]MCC9306130.1 hypothetical protein [Kitasatospora humi]